MQLANFIFREAETIGELLPFLHLRYQVALESRNAGAYSQNSAGIELDKFDRYARHFGLSRQDAEGSVPVGYIRMVTDQKVPLFDEVVSLFDANSIVQHQSPRFPFPLMTYHPDSEAVRQRYLELTAHGEVVVEASRLSLVRSVRSPRIARQFVGAVFAAFMALGVDRAFLTCPPLHAPMYELFGFKPIRGTSIAVCAKYDLPMCCLEGSRSAIPLGVIDQILRMKKEFEQFGEITFEGLARQRILTMPAVTSDSAGINAVAA